MDRDNLRTEIDRLKQQVSALEGQLDSSGHYTEWPPRGYYTTYHVLAGMVLGLFGAAASLLFNIIGAAMVGRHPLELIRVYLTFPLGEKALEVQSGFVLAAGCCLYLGTGMIGVWLINLCGVLSFTGHPGCQETRSTSSLIAPCWSLSWRSCGLPSSFGLFFP